jgi:predicted nucleic acid-binding protein
LNAYLDTSLLVAALVPEAASRRVHDWLEAQPAASLVISDWTITQFASALTIKLRTGELTLNQRAAVQAAWTVLRVESLVVLPLTPSVFATAATFVNQSTSGLRAGDALHLAVAAANGCAIATLDKVQARAAPKCGVPIALR